MTLPLRFQFDVDAVIGPMSYHNGSVWPHDNAIIAAEMKRMAATRNSCGSPGRRSTSRRRARDFRLPELYCGFERSERVGSHLPGGVHPAGLGGSRAAAARADDARHLRRRAVRALRIDRRRSPTGSVVPA